MAALPGPCRAAIGLVASLVEDPRLLPMQAVELPVTIVSTAMRLSLRTQQHYAAWVTKGDEVLAQWRGAPDEPPAWATFDPPVEVSVPEGPSAPEQAAPGGPGAPGEETPPDGILGVVPVPATRRRRPPVRGRTVANTADGADAASTWAAPRDREPSAFDDVAAADPAKPASPPRPSSRAQRSARPAAQDPDG